MYEKMIFVAGHKRAGTTWISTVLSTCADTKYLHEPDAPREHPKDDKGDWAKTIAIREFGSWQIPDELKEWSGKALRDYTNFLMRHYWGDELVFKNLILKVPETERIEFMLDVYEPHHTIFIRRHPLAIVNSYVKIGWVDDYLPKEWARFIYNPEHFNLAQVVNPVHQLIILIHARNNYIDSIAEERNITAIDYEDFCEHPYRYFPLLMEDLGLLWQGKDSIIEYVDPDINEEPSNDKFEVKKRSRDRREAWKHELPKPLLESGIEFIREMKLDYPLPP